MKGNLSYFLIQKENIDEKRRKRIVNGFFGPGGLADSNDSFVFESAARKLNAQYKQYEEFI